MTAVDPGGPGLRFGVSLPPRARDLDAHLELVEAAEAGGLDLAGVMDHPYIPRDLDTFSLLAALHRRRPGGPGAGRDRDRRPGPEWAAAGADPIRASAEQWAELLARLARDLRFDTFVF